MADSVSQGETPAVVKGQRKRAPRKRIRAQKRLKRVFDPYRGSLTRLHAWSLLTRLAPIAVPLTLRFALNPIIQQRDQVWLGRHIAPPEALGLLMAVILAVGLLEAVSRYRSMALAASTGHALVADLRRMMFDHLLRLPVSFHKRRGTGRLLLRFIGDSDALRTWITRAGPQMFADRAFLGVLAATMLFLNWRLGLIALAPLPLLAVGFLALRPKLRQLTRKSRRKQAAFVGHLQERFADVRQIKLLDARHGARAPMMRLAREIGRLNASRDRAGALFGGVGQLAAAAGIALAMGVGVPMVWWGWSSIGELIAFAWLAIHLGITVRSIARCHPLKQKAAVSTERILALLERRSEPNRAGPLPEFDARGVSIDVEEVTCRRPHPRAGNVGEPLTLRISGTGVHRLDPALEPALLFDLLLTFRRPAGGRILVDGQNVDSVNVLSLRRAFGIVPTHPRLFEGTVADNIRAGDPELREEEICSRMVRSGLLPSDEEAHRWLRRKVRSGGGNLSLVECHRAALARVICSAPPFVLFEGMPAHPRSAADMAAAIEFLEGRAMILIGGRCSESQTASAAPLLSQQCSGEPPGFVTSGDTPAPGAWH